MTSSTATFQAAIAVFRNDGQDVVLNLKQPLALRLKPTQENAVGLEAIRQTGIDKDWRNLVMLDKSRDADREFAKAFVSANRTLIERVANHLTKYGRCAGDGLAAIIRTHSLKVECPGVAEHAFRKIDDRVGA
jgi:hypothetical protein